MADQLLDTSNSDSEKVAEDLAKKVYRRPARTQLGSLRDLTMTASNSGANDGMPSRGTKRGGNFESTDGER